ncbi:hypothetical protein F7725_008793 [Dissostichus mawsoni]|uniref:Uncharacterized protein n=1 Tax=Dissostichus mawsoni TaxID=36200 RepID=A0A7J5Y8C0_DISMA|nr:hypothetical protein F7725_008793 [Dissostichus mawsoni]
MMRAPVFGKPHSDGHGDPQRPQRSLPLSDGPGVSLQLPQQLLGAQVLGPPEHVALGDAFRALQLVHLHHASEGDEPHQRGGGQQRERHLEALLQSLQVLLLQTGGSALLCMWPCCRAQVHTGWGQVFLSLRGDSSAARGTTSRVASRRDEGQTFQLSRTPSRSSF